MTNSNKILQKLCELVEATSSSSSSSEEVLNAILLALQTQPQIEGLHVMPVCFADGSSGFISLVLDETTNTYTKRIFDNQYNEIAEKPIVPCTENTVQLGDPIEVCV